MFKKTVLESLRDAEAELRASYGVTGLCLFGSMARGDGRADSDIDVAVEFAGEFDPFSLCGVSGVLSDRIGASVDVVVQPVRNAALKAAIEREGVRAF